MAGRKWMRACFVGKSGVKITKQTLPRSRLWSHKEMFRKGSERTKRMQNFEPHKQRVNLTSTYETTAQTRTDSDEQLCPIPEYPLCPQKPSPGGDPSAR